MPGVFRKAVTQTDKHHQTGKPTEVMRWLCRACPPGEIVLDPFAGSGTTLLAALLMGRRTVGFEVDPDYLAIARDRLETCDEIPPLMQASGLFDSMP